MIILSLMGLVGIVWFALLIAPIATNGILEIVNELPEVINNPFNITFHENSITTVLFLCLIYGIGITVFMATRKNYRRNVEHGSACLR